MMIKKWLLTATVPVLGLVCCLVGSAAHAAGGIYFDNVQIKNDGKVVLSENFDDGDVSDWYQLTEATLLSVKDNPPSRVLWLNKHGQKDDMARHKFNVPQVGLLEFGAHVYVPSAVEQYNWQNQKDTSLYVSLEFNGVGNQMWFVIFLKPQEQGCRITVRQNAPGGAKFQSTPQPVIPIGKWVYATFRLDPDAKTITGYIDGKQVASAPYDPSVCGTLTGLTFNGTFGDGSQRTD